MKFSYYLAWLGCFISSSYAIAGPSSEAGSRQFLAGEDVGVLRLDPRLDDIIPSGAVVKKLVTGFVFAEGPVWDTQGQRLLFTDVRDNKIYQWQNDSLTLFLDPVFDGPMPPGMQNISANGLTFDAQQRLVVAEHGNRQVSRFDSAKNRSAIATHYQGNRFNSPNDLIYDSAGNLYFTDPPYGLRGLDASPLKELNFNGVYRLDIAGTLDLLSSSQTRPNGLALSPDEDWLYVANSNSKNIWMAYELSGSSVMTDKIFFDAGGIEAPGVPDGMKVDKAGNIFATGPGGVLIISADGEHLGTISTGEITANVGWGGAAPGDPCGSNTLYMTATSSLYSIEVLTGGCSPGK
jgi:gluconolactonase